MGKRSTVLLAAALICGFLPGTVSLAWSSLEHREISAAAVGILHDSVLEITDREVDLLARSSVQPDLMRPREMPMLRELEAPRHYIDIELLQGNTLPETASDYYKLLTRLGDARSGLLGPDWQLESVGALPYALVESTERLAAIFAQLRRRPEDADLRSMALHQAGIMAHYAQDLCQPLHTTLDHDGRARADGTSPATGIHRQVDSLLRTVSGKSLAGPSRAYENLFEAVVSELDQSHSQVDRVYRLSEDLEAFHRRGEMSRGLERFARQRYERAVQFTADLIHTAWQKSQTIQVPAWAGQ